MAGVKYGSRRTKATTKPPDGVLLPLAGRDDGPRLFPVDLVDTSWDKAWSGMPAYEMGSTEPFRKVVMQFRSDEELEEFGRLIGVKMTDRTESVWFTTDEDYALPRTMLWAGGGPPPRYPIYVPSVGRWDTPLTSRALDAIGVPHRVVVEPAQRDAYAAAVGADRLLVLPHDYSAHNTGSHKARNWIWRHSLAEGHARHWVVDDNVKGFLRLNRNRRIAVGDGAIFRAAEDFTDRHDNVAFSGFNYMYLINERGADFPPFYLNTRIYSMILVNNVLPYRWRGRYNEDTDICLRALKDGWCTVLFNAFLGDKRPTLSMTGGNTDTVYATGDNRLEFARSLERQHPDVARVVWRYGRWHHEVDYSRFRANKLKLRAGAPPPPEDPEYGMRLVRSDRVTRYPQKPG